MKPKEIKGCYQFAYAVNGVEWATIYEVPNYPNGVKYYMSAINRGTLSAQQAKDMAACLLMAAKRLQKLEKEPAKAKPKR